MEDESALLGPDLPAHQVEEENLAELLTAEEASDFEGARLAFLADGKPCDEVPCGHEEPEPEHESEPQAALKAPAPEPLMRGRFAVYETPDKGYHLTYQLDGEEEAQHLEFPGMLVALAKKRGAAAGGIPGLGKLFGGA